MANQLYLISFSDDVPSIINDYIAKSYTWAHYLPSTWIVSSDLPLDDIVDRFSKILSSSVYDKRFVVVRFNDTDIDGYLPHSAWRWITNQQRQIELHAIENPSLYDMAKSGMFDEELDATNRISGIDSILNPYKTRTPEFEFDLVRGRMTRFIIKKLASIANHSELDQFSALMDDV